MTTAKRSDEWPDWLSAHDTAIHNAIENCFARALEHCYASADADGSYWTEEGLWSIAARNVMLWMRDQGIDAPPYTGPVDRINADEIHRYWIPEDEDEVPPGGPPNDYATTETA